MGNVSIEVDTLIPVARALGDSGQSVVVLFGTEKNVPEEITQRLRGIQVVPISSDDLLGNLHGFFWSDVGENLWLMSRAFVCLFPLRGSVEAFWNRGVCWLHDLLHPGQRNGSGNNSSANIVSKALLWLPNLNPAQRLYARWPNATPGGFTIFCMVCQAFRMTRGISSDIYCYSRADRDFFLRNGWSKLVFTRSDTPGNAV